MNLAASSANLTCLLSALPSRMNVCWGRAIHQLCQVILEQGCYLDLAHICLHAVNARHSDRSGQNMFLKNGRVLDSPCVLFGIQQTVQSEAVSISSRLIKFPDPCPCRNQRWHLVNCGLESSTSMAVEDPSISRPNHHLFASP